MVLLESGARTATTTTPDQKAGRLHRGVRLYLNISDDAGGSETLTVQIQGQDPASGAWVNATKFTAESAATTGTFQYELYPGSVDTGTIDKYQVQGGALPRTWRAVVTHSSTGSWTYSLGAHLIP